MLFINKVADDLTKLRLKFDPKLLESFESWFKDITQENEQTVQSSVSIETEASAGAEIPFISKLTAKLIGQIKGSRGASHFCFQIVDGCIRIIYLDRFQCERLARGRDRERDARTTKNAFYQIGMLPVLVNKKK
ncbi:hypothetical protein QUA56_34350 [Microcoleus sp. N3A4]|uniref:hypothetical protein n=1 Tax=Microcoleus sp. N3A4 TaxID=3055379 RepID=UPI002FD6C5F0